MLYYKQLEQVLDMLVEDSILDGYCNSDGMFLLKLKDNKYSIVLDIQGDYVRLNKIKSIMVDCSKSRFIDYLKTKGAIDLYSIVIAYVAKYNKVVLGVPKGLISYDLTGLSKEAIGAILGIDEELKDALYLLNNNGYKTVFSCIGHNGPLNLQLEYSDTLEFDLSDALMRRNINALNLRYVVVDDTIYKVLELSIYGYSKEIRADKLDIVIQNIAKRKMLRRVVDFRK